MLLLTLCTGWLLTVVAVCRGACACVSLCAAYPPLYPNFPASAMDTPLKYHEQELSYAGIDLKKLVDSGKKVGCTTWPVGFSTQLS